MNYYSESRELAVVSQAERALAVAESVDEIVQVRDLAKMARKLVETKRLGEVAAFRAAEVRIRAERKLGEFLRSQALARAAPGNQYTTKLDRSTASTGPITLEELGLTKDESSQAQQILDIPAKDLEQFFKDRREQRKVPTLTAVLRLARRFRDPELDRREPSGTDPAPFIPRLAPLIAGGEHFKTIYADPPWPPSEVRRTAGKDLVEHLLREPVWLVAADDAHLHLWTPDAYLHEALRVMQAWQFDRVSGLVWLSPSTADPRYWQGEKYYLLLGVRGEMPICDRNQPGYVKARYARRPQPEEIVQLIERVSQGPYLELCGWHCSEREGWRCCGTLSCEEE